MEEKQLYFLKCYTFTLLRDEEPFQQSSTISISNLIKSQPPPDWFLYGCSGEGKVPWNMLKDFLLLGKLAFYIKNIELPGT